MEIWVPKEMSLQSRSNRNAFFIELFRLIFLFLFLYFQKTYVAFSKKPASPTNWSVAAATRSIRMVK